MAALYFYLFTLYLNAVPNNKEKPMNKKTESIRIATDAKRYVASVAKKENRTIQGQLSVIIAEWQAMREADILSTPKKRL